MDCINPNTTDLLFPTVLAKVPDLSAILIDVLGETQLKIARMLQNEADEDNCKIMAWSLDGHFKSVYQASMDLINVGSEDLKMFFKCLGALDFMKKGVIRGSGPSVRPAEAINKREKRAFQGPISTSKLVAKKKEHSRGKSCKAQGLPPHNPPPSSNEAKLLSTKGHVKVKILPPDNRCRE